MAATQTEGKITALYEHLSRDDDLTGDSNSIINQKKYLETYAAQQGYGNCLHYTDNGWSGGNFERPAWKRLVEDIESGKVIHVIVKDLSRKQRTVIRVKGESGKLTTNNAICGYKKDPKNKYHWLIDEEAAAVVRRIFRLTIEGVEANRIAKILFEDKIDAPAVHAAKQGNGIWKNKENFASPYNWTGTYIREILYKQRQPKR